MLLDSNIIIYSVKPQYPEIRAFLKGRSLFASILSYVEVLGYHGLTATNQRKLERLFGSMTVEPVTDAIAERAAHLRRQRKRLQTGDAIIAATALELEMPLATHDQKDFKWIDGLPLVDPVESA